MFDLYKDAKIPVYSVTNHLDIYPDAYLSNFKFYKKSHALMAIAGECMNELESFKYRIKEGKPLYISHGIDLGFTVAKDTGFFNFAIANYDESFYNTTVNINRAIYEAEHRDSLACVGGDRLDIFYMSCIPSLSFDHLQNPLKGGDYDSIPVVIIGKIEDNKLPICIQAHHGFVTAKHMSDFFNLYQEKLNDL